MIEPIVKRCAGLDVHKMKVTVTVIIEEEGGRVKEETREYKTFREHRRQLCRWLKIDRHQQNEVSQTQV